VRVVLWPRFWWVVSPPSGTSSIGADHLWSKRSCGEPSTPSSPQCAVIAHHLYWSWRARPATVLITRFIAEHQGNARVLSDTWGGTCGTDRLSHSVFRVLISEIASCSLLWPRLQRCRRARSSPSMAIRGLFLGKNRFRCR